MLAAATFERRQLFNTTTFIPAYCALLSDYTVYSPGQKEVEEGRWSCALRNRGATAQRDALVEEIGQEYRVVKDEEHIVQSLY